MPPFWKSSTVECLISIELSEAASAALGVCGKADEGSSLVT